MRNTVCSSFSCQGCQALTCKLLLRGMVWGKYKYFLNHLLYSCPLEQSIEWRINILDQSYICQFRIPSLTGSTAVL